MVNDHSDSERGNPLLPHGLLFPISSKGSFMYIIMAFVTPVVGALAGTRRQSTESLVEDVPPSLSCIIQRHLRDVAQLAAAEIKLFYLSKRVVANCTVRVVVGSILHGGPIGLLVVPASVPRLV